jgi:hypothetical protein
MVVVAAVSPSCPPAVRQRLSSQETRGGLRVAPAGPSCLAHVLFPAASTGVLCLVKPAARAAKEFGDRFRHAYVLFYGSAEAFSEMQLRFVRNVCLLLPFVLTLTDLDPLCVWIGDWESLLDSAAGLTLLMMLDEAGAADFVVELASILSSRGHAAGNDEAESDKTEVPVSRERIEAAIASALPELGGSRGLLSARNILDHYGSLLAITQDEQHTMFAGTGLEALLETRS